MLERKRSAYFLVLIVVVGALLATMAFAPTQAQAKTKAKEKTYTVSINAGHQAKGNLSREKIGPGSRTSKAKVSYGCVGVRSRVAESRVNLQVAKELKRVLVKRGYKVIMTRTSQKVNISNKQRAKIGNKADIAISIHCDSGPSSARGAHTICIKQNNPYCKKLYKKSRKLAKAVIGSYCAKTKIRSRGVSYRNDLTGLNWSRVPAIYIEMGFLSNRTEDKKLTSAKFQKKCARGIANGIDRYFGKK